MSEKKKEDVKKILTENFWQSFREHVGKALDRMDPLDTLLYSLAAYSGFNWNNEPSGAILGMMSLKLATVPMSQVSNVAGVTGLALIGLTTPNSEVLSKIDEFFNWLKAEKPTVEEEEAMEKVPTTWEEYIASLSGIFKAQWASIVGWKEPEEEEEPEE